MVLLAGRPHTKDVPLFAFRTCLHVLTIFLSLLTTISLPTLVTLDVARIDLGSSLPGGISEIRLGIWSYCVYRNLTVAESCHVSEPCRKSCSNAAYGYSINMSLPSTTQTLHLSPSHTRSLAVHCAALVSLVISTTLLLARCPNIWIDRAVLSILIITSITDGVFFGHIEHVSTWDLNLSKPVVSTGPGLWSAVTALVVFVVAICASSDAEDHRKTSARRREEFIQRNMLLPLKDNERRVSSAYNRGLDCPSCWENKKEICVIVPCGHMICRGCYEVNARRSHKCPLEERTGSDQCPERLRSENMILVRPVCQEIL